MTTADTTRPTPRSALVPVTHAPSAGDVAACAHPIGSIRLDGIWLLGEPRVPHAAVTCLDCKSSFSLRVRDDLSAAILARTSVLAPAGAR